MLSDILKQAEKAAAEFYSPAALPNRIGEYNYTIGFVDGAQWIVDNTKPLNDFEIELNLNN